MKRILCFALSCIVGTTLVLGQSSPTDPPLLQEPKVHTQSLSFSSSDAWIPGTTVTLNVVLTYGGYSSYGLSYWLELPTAIAPYVTLADAQYSTFLDINQGPAFGAQFNSTSGASANYLLLPRDLGATTQIVDPAHAIPQGTYSITTLTFSLAPEMALVLGQSFTMLSTTHSPRISEVTDTDFMDNNIIPAGQFVIAVVPEPSTSVLLVSVVTGLGLMVHRRRQGKGVPEHAAGD